MAGQRIVNDGPTPRRAGASLVNEAQMPPGWQVRRL